MGSKTPKRLCPPPPRRGKLRHPSSPRARRPPRARRSARFSRANVLPPRRHHRTCVSRPASSGRARQRRLSAIVKRSSPASLSRAGAKRHGNSSGPTKLAGSHPRLPRAPRPLSPRPLSPRPLALSSSPTRTSWWSCTTREHYISPPTARRIKRSGRADTSQSAAAHTGGPLPRRQKRQSSSRRIELMRPPLSWRARPSRPLARRLVIAAGDPGLVLTPYRSLSRGPCRAQEIEVGELENIHPRVHRKHASRRTRFPKLDDPGAPLKCGSPASTAACACEHCRSQPWRHSSSCSCRPRSP